jgi:uncharacterized membrane protein
MKKYFVTGLLIWVPLGITIWILSTLIGAMDQSILLLPEALRPEKTIGFSFPGIGAILTLLVVFLTGVLTANYFGRTLFEWSEKLFARIPVVKTIYSSVKQVSDTLLSSSGEAFRKALLVPYPHANTFTIAFLTGQPGESVARHLNSEYISVYVPTTPNPTSGFFLLVARKDVVELDMTVDEALKYIISMGVVAPGAPANH